MSSLFKRERMGRMLKKNTKRRLEIAIILIAAAIGLGYTNLTTIGVSGNNFAAQLNNDFNGTSPVSPLIDAGTVIQGNVAGKAGTSADQIGGTQALAQINKQVCVDGYGAKGDGVTDDAPAIQAAIDACADGCLIEFNCTSGVNTSKNYLLGSLAGTGGGSPTAIHEYHSNDILDLNGATITTGQSRGITLGNDGGTSSGWESPSPLYNVTGATVGSNVLTMVTPGQESNFVAGQKFYIQGEHTDNNNEGGGFISFVDTTNHKLWLRYPLGRTYTPTPQINPMIGYFDNITLRNGTIHVTGGIGLLIFVVNNFNIENITLNTDEGVGADPFTDIANWNGQFLNDRFTAHCAEPLQLASRGNMNTNVIGGVYVNDNNNGVACGGQQSTTSVGEATENINFIGTTLINNAGSTNGDTCVHFGTGAVNTTVAHSTCTLTSALSNGYGMGNVDGTSSTVTKTRMIDNVIQINQGKGIVLKAVEAIANGNDVIVQSTAAASECAYLSDFPVIFNNNECEMNGQTHAIEDNVAGATITNNVITNASSSGANSPVLVNGTSSPSGDSVIMGNVNVNAANYSAANFATWGSGHTNIIASRNSPSTQDQHP